MKLITQTLSDQNVPVNITSPDFKIVVCDGPTPPKGVVVPNDYVPCDFNGVILQVQHIIDIAIAAGVLIAIIGFCYAGFLYIKGGESDIKKAKEFFPKIFWGFIIMISAWFIVYQILSWLTDNAGFKTLLGG